MIFSRRLLQEKKEVDDSHLRNCRGASSEEFVTRHRCSEEHGRIYHASFRVVVERVTRKLFLEISPTESGTLSALPKAHWCLLNSDFQVQSETTRRISKNSDTENQESNEVVSEGP